MNPPSSRLANRFVTADTAPADNGPADNGPADNGPAKAPLAASGPAEAGVEHIADVHDRWVAAFDELERLVARQSAALDAAAAEDLPVGELSFRQPTVPWPLPANLRARATALLTSTTELIERARTLSRDMAPRGPARHPRPVGRTTVTHFDHRA
jgi:hypothetical protein